MGQITYADKVALNVNPEIAAINKVQDTDMNEIKKVVNENYNNTIQITNTQPSDSDWKIWIDSDKQTDNTYYNDNGTPTQFKATTYDTLPVGTEVDYDGETVPTGWTEVEEWTLLDTATGTTPISLNNINYNELYIVGKAKNDANDNGIWIDFYILKNILTSTAVSMRKGYYYDASTNGMIFIDISNGTVSLNSATRNGVSKTSVSQIAVYYK